MYVLVSCLVTLGFIDLVKVVTKRYWYLRIVHVEVCNVCVYFYVSTLSLQRECVLCVP